MARQIVKINKFSDQHDRNFVKLSTNKFDPVLYTNMYTPSEVHAFNLGIEYMKDKFFKSKFPKDYFKAEWVNTAHTMKDYANFSKMNIKRERPYFVVIPSVDYDYDRENIDMYYAGADTFLKRSNWQRSFFKDYDNRVFLGMQMRALRMPFTFKIRLNTRSEQLDLFRRMELVFRIGGTQRDSISVDLHIPYNMLVNIALLAGFKVNFTEFAGEKIAKIADPLLFLDYLNQHSDIPIVYKFRATNHQEEFFLRVTDLFTHITTKDKLDIDDGEKSGQIDSNFNITMQAVLKIPVPQFFALYNEKPLPYKLETGQNSIPLYSVGQFDIPDTNERGWEQVINTTYMLDPHETSFDISPLFKSNKTEDINKVIDFCNKNYISPLTFIDIQIYREAAGNYIKVPFNFDYYKMGITLGEDLVDEQYLYIAIYIDKKYMNDTLSTLGEFQKTRLSDTKLERHSHS